MTGAHVTGHGDREASKLIARCSNTPRAVDLARTSRRGRKLFESFVEWEWNCLGEKEGKVYLPEIQRLRGVGGGRRMKSMAA